MIGSPTNFQHTGHIGSGDVDLGNSHLRAIQNQMQSKGGYETAFSTVKVNKCVQTACARCQILTAVLLKIQVLWFVALCCWLIAFMYKSAVPLFLGSVSLALQSQKLGIVQPVT